MSFHHNQVHTGVDEPGTGGRYAYCVWRHEGQWYAAFPDYNSVSAIGSGKHHVDYVQDKMRVSTPDAIEMTKIINRCIIGRAET